MNFIIFHTHFVNPHNGKNSFSLANGMIWNISDLLQFYISQKFHCRLLIQYADRLICDRIMQSISCIDHTFDAAFLLSHIQIRSALVLIHFLYGTNKTPNPCDDVICSDCYNQEHTSKLYILLKIFHHTSQKKSPHIKHQKCFDKISHIFDFKSYSNHCCVYKYMEQYEFQQHIWNRQYDDHTHQKRTCHRPHTDVAVCGSTLQHPSN